MKQGQIFKNHSEIAQVSLEGTHHTFAIFTMETLRLDRVTHDPEPILENFTLVETAELVVE